MHLCLFEDAAVRHLEPLVLTRAAGDLRLGIRTLFEMQRAAFAHTGVVLHTRALVADATAEAHPYALVNALPDDHAGVLFVNARYRPQHGALLDRLRAAADSSEPARAFVQDDTLIAAWLPDPKADLLATDAFGLSSVEGVQQEAVSSAHLIDRLWDLLTDVGHRVEYDFHALGQQGTAGASVHESAVLVNADHVYLAPGAQVKAGAVVSAESGPVYLGPNATIGENSVARGPLYLGRHATLKPLSRIAESAVGPWSKVGGEVSQSVVHSYSNKGHDGYLGNAYLGRWCNVGADTNTSNLRNDYGPVTLFDAVAQAFLPTGQQFLGLVMADHAKCGINTMFNTGTVVGVASNVYGGGFVPRLVPSFAWGGWQERGFVPYRIDKALQVAEAVMKRRDTVLTDAERTLLTTIAQMGV
ncbi:MAG: putative sugar nucleotidyl transferase [Bacteroidota bacterium]